MAKKKKEPKVEQVFESKDENKEEITDAEKQKGDSNIDDFLGKETEEDHLTEKQKKKLEKLDNVKNKISKILQSSNIEIVDENFDDEYEFDASENVDGQSQQDYDSLKALFGEKDKGKKQELTLTIDDFDYAYIGQYLEEYDLMHMKNIKKVKIQKKRSPKLKKALIAAMLVIVIGVGAFLGFYFTRAVPVYLKAVSLNFSERNDYYVDDKFDYTNLYFIAEYSDGKKEMISLDNSYFNSSLSTGFFEKTGENDSEIKFVKHGQTNLVFSYSGFDVTYTVTVQRKQEYGVHALYHQAIFDMNKDDIITTDLLKVFVDYGDFGIEKVDFSSSIHVSIDGVKCEFKNNGYKIVKDGGTTFASNIVVKFGNFEVELDNTKNYI